MTLKQKFSIDTLIFLSSELAGREDIKYEITKNSRKGINVILLLPDKRITLHILADGFINKKHFSTL